MSIKRVVSVIGIAMVVSLVGVSPASAGQHSWNSDSWCPHGGTTHGQVSVGSGYVSASTSHSDWDVFVQGKYYDSLGRIRYTSDVWSEDIAVVTALGLFQHFSQW